MITAPKEVIQELDRIAIEERGIESLFLMENAGRAVATIVLETLREIGGNAVNVICGKGNNAGDGFVCARYLLDKGIDVRIIIIGEAINLKKDALINYKRIKEKNKIIEIAGLSELNKNRVSLFECDLFVDAIFGIGLKGAPEGIFKKIIELVIQTKKPVISVDIPSGLDADLGRASGTCIKAIKTVTFSLAKKGFFLNQGQDYCGDVIVADIGIPKDLIDKYVK